MSGALLHIALGLHCRRENAAVAQFGTIRTLADVAQNLGATGALAMHGGDSSKAVADASAHIGQKTRRTDDIGAR